jgi:hypothetical protein
MITDKGDNRSFDNACLFCVLKLSDDKTRCSFYLQDAVSKDVYEIRNIVFLVQKIKF